MSLKYNWKEIAANLDETLATIKTFGTDSETLLPAEIIEKVRAIQTELGGHW